MHAIAIAVGDHGPAHVRAVGAIGNAGLYVRTIADDLADVLGNVVVEPDVGDLDLVAVAGKAGACAVDGRGVRASGAIRQQIGDADAPVILAGKFRVVQPGTGIEHAEADSLAGQAARIGVVGIDRRKTPVTCEFITAPALQIARLPQDRTIRTGADTRAGEGNGLAKGGGRRGECRRQRDALQITAECGGLLGALLLVALEGIAVRLAKAGTAMAASRVPVMAEANRVGDRRRAAARDVDFWFMYSELP